MRRWPVAVPALVWALVWPHPAATQRALPSAPAEQVRQYRADAPKTVVELQQFRSTTEQPAPGVARGRARATLIDLNPAINSWFLMGLDSGSGDRHYFHLENPDPQNQTIALAADFDGGLVLARGAERYRCALWSGRALEDASAMPVPYAPLCDSRLYLHNKVRGARSRLEAAVEFLRDRVWGGEELVNLAKRTVLSDPGREPAKLSGEAGTAVEAAAGPRPALLDPAFAAERIGRASLGIGLTVPDDAALPIGRWARVRELDGAFVSLIAPRAVAPVLLASHRDRVGALDAAEASAMVYLIAFDMRRFDLGFGLGTDHPRLGWSARTPDSMRLPSLPGPDGIDSPAPLIASGMIPPQDTSRTVAAFVGGFKRYHGAFKYGALAQRNHASHYGFVQEGVVLGKLQPGLSTLYVLRDGSVRMQVWTEVHDDRLAEVRYARQNGVPLVEWDATRSEPVPGALVNRWGAGNWSGSASASLRTVRAGACLQRGERADYLIYAYFSSATPSAMARVFQAYGCHHAMQLDINAPILTYLAVYTARDGRLLVRYLVSAMSEADSHVQGRPVPRFLGMSDNRDFFYLMRRRAGAP